MHVVTVFDHRRTAEVRTLAQSLRAHHADARMTAVFIGAAVAPLVDGALVSSLDEVWSLEPWWPSVARSAPEHLDGVLVAPALRTALAQDDGPVVMLGCQTLLVAPLTPLLDALESAGVVLVATAEAELPADGELPGAAEVADAGVVNRRVLALRRGASAERLLASWPTVADGDGPRPELVADSVQRYLDRFATLEDDARVLSDPGLGLAYWNVPLRPVAGDPGALTTGGAPLRLLDLAGFDPAQPGVPWPAQSRFRPSTAPELNRLLDAHGRELRRQAPDVAGMPFRHDHHGRPLDAFLRERVADAYADGALRNPPWTPEGTRQLDAWLDEPGERGTAVGLTRYHNAVWEQRDDLRAAYPDLDGPDGPGYAGWLTAYGPRDLGMPLASLPRRDATTAPLSPADDPPPPWGVNVAGFFRSELGLGEAARLLITGLDAVTVPALPVQGALVPPCRQEAEFTFTSPNESPYPINIICMNGDSIPVFAREVAPTFFSERHTIALWWWEIVGAFPESWAAAFDYVDEVWVASDHILEAVAPSSPKPVIKVRMPVTLPRVRPYDRASLGLPVDGFTFLYVFDYHSTAARKNPVGHVEAFKRAFPPGSGAKLVLKCINADRIPAQHERTLLAVGDHPDITVIDRYVSAAEKNAMLAACDCYLSLHRSEGFGLTPAEAMALGKPVIATRYGGTLEFMTDQTAYLVDHRPVAVGPGAHPYPPAAMWVDPDLDHAAALMRRVFERRSEARAVGERAARYIAEHHSPAEAGRVMRERLQVIYNGLADDYQAPALRTTPRLDGLMARVDADPAAPGGSLKGGLRKASSRVASPWVAHQRRIDQELVRGLGGLQHDVDRIAGELAARADGHLREERTQNTAALRRIRAQLADQQSWLASLDARLSEHRALPYMSTPFELWADPIAGEVEGFREPLAGATADTAYRAFEDRFRGSRERIVELQQPYARLLADFAPVLDCGCGRGELLEVLGAAGIEARGVDLDSGMLDVARSAGFDVALGDATEALRRASPQSLGAVTAMQVIEHMPYEELRAFLLAARGALRPGGRLVVETVNPHMLASMKGFWIDPTHQHPLFPEVVLELCRETGFGAGFVFHPNASGNVAQDRFAAPAYAVVAEAHADVG